MNSRCFNLYRAYSISFNSSNVDYFFWSSILKDRIKVHEKKKKVVALCSRPPQNVKLGIFTSQSCSDGKQMYKKGMMNVQSCFANVTYCFFAVLVDVTVIVA